MKKQRKTVSEKIRDKVSQDFIERASETASLIPLHEADVARALPNVYTNERSFSLAPISRPSPLGERLTDTTLKSSRTWAHSYTKNKTLSLFEEKKPSTEKFNIHTHPNLRNSTKFSLADSISFLSSYRDNHKHREVVFVVDSQQAESSFRARAIRRLKKWQKIAREGGTLPPENERYNELRRIAEQSANRISLIGRFHVRPSTAFRKLPESERQRIIDTLLNRSEIEEAMKDLVKRKGIVRGDGSVLLREDDLNRGERAIFQAYQGGVPLRELWKRMEKEIEKNAKRQRVTKSESRGRRTESRGRRTESRGRRISGARESFEAGLLAYTHIPAKGYVRDPRTHKYKKKAKTRQKREKRHK